MLDLHQAASTRLTTLEQLNRIEARMTTIEGKQSISVTVLQAILSVALLVVGLLAGHYLWT